MRLAGTCTRYSKKAMPQLIRITTGRATSRKRRWPYQASVMKAFETISNAAAANPSRYPPPPIPSSPSIRRRRPRRPPCPSPPSMEERAEHARRERRQRADRHLRVGDHPAHRELDAPDPAPGGLVIQCAEEGDAPRDGVEAEVGGDHRAAQVERRGVLTDRAGEQDADPVGGADPAVADRDRRPVVADLGP